MTETGDAHLPDAETLATITQHADALATVIANVHMGSENDPSLLHHVNDIRALVGEYQRGPLLCTPLSNTHAKLLEAHGWLQKYQTVLSSLLNNDTFHKTTQAVNDLTALVAAISALITAIEPLL